MAATIFLRDGAVICAGVCLFFLPFTGMRPTFYNSCCISPMLYKVPVSVNDLLLAEDDIDLALRAFPHDFAALLVF